MECICIILEYLYKTIQATEGLYLSPVLDAEAE